MSASESSIRDFYANKTVFLTGATGFVGKVICEKLIRSCPRVHRVYLLIRKKKGKTGDERLEDLIRSTVFDRMREDMGAEFGSYVRGKLAVVEGDLMVDHFGVSDDVWSMLQEETHVILHNAATILFDEPLDEALENNCMGALRVLDLAHGCPNLRSMVHCSTAYVSTHRTSPHVVLEEIHECPEFADAEASLDEMLSLPVEVLRSRQDELKGKFPNTYTMTKNLTEKMLRLRRGSVPLTIVRPSIICGAYGDGDPQRGWIDNAMAAGAYYLTAMLGALQYVKGNRHNIGDQIPVDYVGNTIIAASYACRDTQELPVFHSGTSASNPCTWGKVSDLLLSYTRNHPMKKALGPPDVHFLNHTAAFKAAFFLKYTLPSMALNTYAHSRFGTAQQRRDAEMFQKVASKAYMVAETFEFFVTNEWLFSTAKTEALHESLSAEEQRVFQFDPRTVDWYTFIRSTLWGIRHYVMGESELMNPDLERHSTLYFEKRSFQVFADLTWAYSTHPRASELSESAPMRVIEGTMSADSVRAAIEALAAQDGVPVARVQDEAQQIMDEMAGQFHMPLVRAMAWFFRKVYNTLYDSIIVDELGLKRLRDAHAANPDVPLIIIPTHRSYIDFLIISYLMFAYEMPIPQIAAGDDFLNMMFVRYMFRHSGAFFMRRSFRGDHLYKTIFKEYVHQLMYAGFSLEFFIEGTRSRTGKNLPPKLGLMGMVTEPFYEGRVSDLCVVPVSINYERFVEEGSHASQLLGEGKQKPSFRKLVKGAYSRLLGETFGRISVQFAPPIMYSQYVAEHSELPRKQLTLQLGHRILRDFNQEAVVMSTAMVAAIVMAYRHGIEKELVVSKYQWLSDEVHARGSRVDVLYRDMSPEQIVDRAVRLLRDMLVERRGFIEPKADTRDSHSVFLRLSIYRNQVPHVFLHESILLAVLASGRSRLPELFEEAQFVALLLSVEFPSHDFEDVRPDWPAIARVMEERGLISLEGESAALRPESNKLSFFLCSLIWPFIDAHWAAALALYALQPERVVRENLLVGQTQWFAEKLFFDNIIVHYEACSKESMRCALTVFQRLGVLQPSEERGSLQLAAPYTQEHALQQFITRIGQFRKPSLKLSSEVKQLKSQVLGRFPLLAKL